MNELEELKRRIDPFESLGQTRPVGGHPQLHGYCEPVRYAIALKRGHQVMKEWHSNYCVIC